MAAVSFPERGGSYPLIKFLWSRSVIENARALVEKFEKGSITQEAAKATADTILRELLKSEIDLLGLQTIREGLFKILRLNIEEVQRKVIHYLHEYLSPYAHVDVLSNQAKEYVFYEELMSALLNDHIRVQGSEDIFLLMFELYEDLLERLWVLPHLVNDRSAFAIIVEQNSGIYLRRTDIWEGIISRIQNQALQKLLMKIKDHLYRITYPLTTSDEDKNCLAEMIRIFRKCPSFTNFGQILHLMGDSNRAIKYHLLQLKKIAELNSTDQKAEEDPVIVMLVFQTLTGLEAAFHASGEHAMAIEACKKHLSLIDERPLPQLDQNYLKGAVFQLQGKAYQALKERQKAIESFKNAAQCGDVEAYLELALEYIAQGDETAANESFETALATAKDNTDRARMYQILGSGYKTARNYRKAIEYFEKALPLGTLRQKGQVHINMGSCYCAIVDLVRANTQYLEAKNIAMQLKDPVMQGKICVNFGNFYDGIGQTDQAATLYLEAVQTTPNIEDKAVALSSLGRACYGTAFGKNSTADMLKTFEKALHYLHEASKLPLKLHERLRVYLTFGQLYNVLRKPQQAIKKLEKALEFYPEVDQMKGYIFRNLGTAYEVLSVVDPALKNPSKVKEYYEKALQIAKDLNNVEEQGGMYQNLGVFYEEQENFVSAEDHFVQSVQCLSVLEQQIERHEWKIIFFEERAQPLLGLERVLFKTAKGTPERILQVTDSRRSRALVSLLRKKLSPLGNNLDLFASLTIPEMQQLAKRLDTTFVIYSLTMIGKDKIIAWIISPQGEIPPPQHLPTTAIAKDLSNIPELFRGFPFNRVNIEEPSEIPIVNIIHQVRGNNEDAREQEEAMKLVREQLIARLENWYEALIAPLEEYLPKDIKQTLTIIPDGFLCQIPFALFRKTKSKEYLIEKYPIIIAPSITTADLISKRSRKFSGKPLIVGNPNTGNPKEDLKTGNLEAEELQKIFKASKEQVLTREEATIEGVKKGMNDAQWIYFSCHGKDGINGDNPYSVFEGHLKLAQVKEQSNGHLQAEEISNITLNAELVVLSACYSGTGKIQHEGSIGHVWSFLAAGAQSVLATYWPLPDSHLTIKMVTDFTNCILKEDVSRLSKAQALKKVMEEQIKANRDQPDQWGSFFLSGLDIRHSNQESKAVAK